MCIKEPIKKTFWKKRFLPKISAWSWKFFGQFSNPWALRVSGMGCYTSKCEKKSLHSSLCAVLLPDTQCLYTQYECGRMLPLLCVQNSDQQVCSSRNRRSFRQISYIHDIHKTQSLIKNSINNHHKKSAPTKVRQRQKLGVNKIKLVSTKYISVDKILALTKARHIYMRLSPSLWLCGLYLRYDIWPQIKETFFS